MVRLRSSSPSPASWRQPVKLKLSGLFFTTFCVCVALAFFNNLRNARTFRVPESWQGVKIQWNIYAPLYEGKIQYVQVDCHPWMTVQVDGKYHLINGIELQSLDPKKYQEIMELSNGR